MTRSHSIFIGLLGTALSASLAGSAAGQTTSGQTASTMMRFETQTYRAASGIQIGDAFALESADRSDDESDGIEKQLSPRFWTVVQAPNTHMIRVHFSQFDLDRNSEIHLTSIADGGTQRFTHAMLDAWQGWSAIFNGDAVLVQLLVAPGETVSFEIDEMSTSSPSEGLGDGGVATLCGTDSRSASSDSRVGRLSGPNCGSGGGCGGCTAWLTSVGCALTAGHCGTASGGLIEFNIPNSSSSGQPVASNPDDQYPVGTTFYALQDGGVGFDWAIMNVGPNANTGLQAHWVQSYFHLTPLNPSDGSTLRITGCGVDNSPSGSQPGTCCATDSNGNCTHSGCNSSSLTLQTSTGAKTDDTTNAVFYAVDTEPANSGSPVIRTSTDFAIGIHTNGGCTSSGGENKGTRLTQATLSQFLNTFLGANSAFVDHADVSLADIGSALSPMQTLPLGVGIAPVGGSVALAGGSYTAAAGNTGVFTKAVTLRAVSGVVTIGN